MCNIKEGKIMGHLFVFVCDFNGKWLRKIMCFVCIKICGRYYFFNIQCVVTPFS